MSALNSISVAMCTYNGEAFLKEQLESILAQTVPPSELVVCDDCSKDATLEILSTFKEKCNFPVIIITNTNNIGINKNFENAIAHCSGEFIAFADQDDIWQPTKIEEIINAFQNNQDCGYIFSDADLIDEHGRPIGRSLWQSIRFNQKRCNKYIADKQLEVMLRDGNFIYGMTMAFRSNFKNIVIPIASRSFADCTHDVWISLILSAIGAYGVPIQKPLVMYRQHEKQLAGAGRRLSLNEFLVKIRSNNNERNLELADALDNIAERLLGARQSSDYLLHARKLLTEKAFHLRVRALVSTKRGFQKLKIVFYETVSGRYGQYSGSYKSILKDLILS